VGCNGADYQHAPRDESREEGFKPSQRSFQENSKTILQGTKRRFVQVIVCSPTMSAVCWGHGNKLGAWCKSAQTVVGFTDSRHVKKETESIGNSRFFCSCLVLHT